MTYYPYWYRLDGADAYLIWYSDESAATYPNGVGESGETDSGEPDGVLLANPGRLLTFRSLADLHGYADRSGLSVEPEVNSTPLDLDTVQRWLGAARKTTVDCETFLSAWNLFSDLASAVQGARAHIDDQKENRIYMKLFWGNNFPAMTPPGKHFTPTWSKSEVGRLRNVLNKGMQMFKNRLSDQAEAARL